MSPQPARLQAAIIALMALAPIALFCQAPGLDKAPSTPPASCGFSQVSLSSVTGSAAYVRLRYEVKALEVAQGSTEQLRNGLKELNGGGTPTVAISGLITGTNQARDSLLCAAYLMGKHNIASEDEATIRVILITAFNREAVALADLLALVKEQMSRPSIQGSNAQTFNDAERMSAITAQQHEAAEDLLQITTLSLLLAVDDRDPNAKTTEYTVLSCEERSELLSGVTLLVKGERTAYSDTAGLIQQFLTKHKCRT